MGKLMIVTAICFLFMGGEVVGGIISNSLAIMSDAAHMLSDVAGFTISYLAIYLGRRPANNGMSFGYHRAEILGALASILLIWGLIVWLFAEAIHRVVHLDELEIDGLIMLITASVGLACNFISLYTLHFCGGDSGHEIAHKNVTSLRNLHPGLQDDCGHEHGNNNNQPGHSHSQDLGEG
jgi:cation diffusion facilitator family transporter